MGLFKKKPKGKNIGLALSGGAVLGAAHIGVLKALDELDFDIACVSGTSIGALVASLTAFGVGWEEIAEISSSLNWLDISEISLSKNGILSNNNLGNLIKEHIDESVFEEAQIPLAVIATDIVNGEKVILEEGSVAKAVMASACIPGVFNPVEINGRLLVDGGIVENVPISPLKKMGAEWIIGVDLHGKQSSSKPENIIEVLMRSHDLTIRIAAKTQTQKADTMIEPDISGFNRINVEQTDDLIEKGYSAAITKLRDVI